MPDLRIPIAPLEIQRPPVLQPPERLFLLVCNNESPPVISWHAQTGLGGGQIAEPSTTWRRATPDDLLAFGFAPIRSAPDLEPEQIMAEFITKLPGKTQVTLLRLLQERYGDG